MSTIKWTPTEDLLVLRRNLEKAFEDLIPSGNFGDWPAFTQSYPTDLYETDDMVMVDVEAPGLSTDDISITVSGNMLTIKGKKQSKDLDDVNYHRKEIRSSSFSRSLLLPGGIDSSQADASFDKGILTISFPKLVEAKPIRIPVN